jgi:DNA repair protein RadA/Sms
VAVLFLDRLSFRRRTGNRKHPFTSNILKITLKTLYVSGEESQKQIKMRAERITSSSDNCCILTETKTQNIFKQIAIEPEIVIIDSIQTLLTDYIESTAGSISQIRNHSRRTD